MRKSNTLLSILLGCPLLLNAHTNPYYFQEIDQIAFTSSNLQSIEVFFDWLASPFVQTCCLILVIISFIYCFFMLLLYALLIHEAIPSKQWMNNWLGSKLSNPLIKKSSIPNSLQKKWSEKQVEEFLLDNKREQLVNSLLP